jgi:hypothetical protein
MHFDGGSLVQDHAGESVACAFYYCFMQHQKREKENEMSMQALNRQVAGTHYKGIMIEPAEYILTNNLPWAEGNVIKYVTRHGEKGGATDLLKAKHYIDMILENTYNCNPDGSFMGSFVEPEEPTPGKPEVKSEFQGERYSPAPSIASIPQWEVQPGAPFPFNAEGTVTKRGLAGAGEKIKKHVIETGVGETQTTINDPKKEE